MGSSGWRCCLQCTLTGYDLKFHCLTNRRPIHRAPYKPAPRPYLCQLTSPCVHPQATLVPAEHLEQTRAFLPVHGSLLPTPLLLSQLYLTPSCQVLYLLLMTPTVRHFINFINEIEFYDSFVQPLDYCPPFPLVNTPGGQSILRIFSTVVSATHSIWHREAQRKVLSGPREMPTSPMAESGFCAAGYIFLHENKCSLHMASPRDDIVLPNLSVPLVFLLYAFHKTSITSQKKWNLAYCNGRGSTIIASRVSPTVHTEEVGGYQRPSVGHYWDCSGT